MNNGTKIIKNLQDLCDYFEADSPAQLNRRIYKDTKCGARISLLLPSGAWLHNGAINAVKTYDYRNCRLNGKTIMTPTTWMSVKRIKGFEIGTIVEGSEATVGSGTILLPVHTSYVDDWIAHMEAEVDRIVTRGEATEVNDDEPEYDYAADDLNFDAAREQGRL